MNKPVARLFASSVVGALMLAPIGGTAAAVAGSRIAGAAASIWSWTVWNWPAWALAALVAVAPVLRSWNNAAVPPSAIAHAKMGAALALGAVWCLRALERRRDRWPRGWIAFFGAWFLWTAIAIIHSTDRGASLRYLALTLSGVSVFCAAFDLRPREKRRLFWEMVAFGGALGALVLLQYAIVVYHVAAFAAPFIVEPRTVAYFASNLLPAAAERYRPSGTMFQPNAMGVYFAFLIPFCVAALRAKSVSRLARWALAAGALLMAGGLYATDSRGAMLWLLVALGCLAFHRGCRWLFGVAAVGAIAAIAAWSVPSVRATLIEKLSARARFQYGLSGRPMIWRHALTLVGQTPFFGVGPGNFNAQYVSRFGYFLPNDAVEQRNQIWEIQTLGEAVIENYHAHDLYLQLMGEAGVVMSLLFILGAFGVIGHCERAAARQPTASLARAWTLAVAADTVGLLIYGIFESQLVFTVGALNLVAGALLALGMSSPCRLRE